jgi:glycosyltransferase involved in cell wall biosynthesis
MLKMGESMGCKFADHMIVISNVIKDLIAERCGRTENVHLIYNGVPEPEICHELEYFKELDVEEGKYILGMCRFVPEKHLHDLVEAYVQLKESHRIPNDVRLVLAGDTDFEDDYSRTLKQKARESGVVLTGYIRGRKLHSLLTNALCYSLPSSHEGLPIALLEAMSYRLPVITSAIPANLEVGLPAACYHEVGDVEALASKLEAIIKKPLQRIDYDMSKYNWDVIAQQVAEIYESMKN